MDKILVALHNYRPLDDRIIKLAEVMRILLADYATFIVATANNPEKFNLGEGIAMLDISNTTIAKSKNTILRYGYDGGYTHTAIFDDDITIKNTADFTAVITKYISLLKQYNLPLVTFGYGREVNRVFGKPSPILAITNDTTGRDEILLNRWPNSTAMFFDNSERVTYREDLVYMDFKELISSLHSKGKKKIPFIGFFMDVPYAYEVFDRDLDVPTHRRIDANLLIREKNSHNIPWEVENNMDKVLIWLSKS